MNVRRLLGMLLALMVAVTLVAVPASAASDTQTTTKVNTKTITESPVDEPNGSYNLPTTYSDVIVGDGSRVETTTETTVTVRNRVKTTVVKTTTKTTRPTSPCPAPQQTVVRPNTDAMSVATGCLNSLKTYASYYGWSTTSSTVKKSQSKVVIDIRFSGRSGYMDIVLTTVPKDGTYKTTYTWNNQTVTDERIKYSLRTYG